MSSLTRQKILKEIEYLKDEARSLEINTIYSSIHDINFKHFKRNNSTVIEVSVDNKEQIEKDNKKLKFIKSICTEGKFEWTAKNYIAKTTKNTLKNMYEIVYPKGKTKDIHVINVVAYHEYLGWIICPIHRPSEKDENDKIINGISIFRDFVRKVPDILKYKDPDDFDSETWDRCARIFYDQTEFEAFNQILDDNMINRELEHVWSLDINSAFGSAFVEEVPEAREYIEELYYTRKQNPQNKIKISTIVGMLGSPYTAELKGLNLKKHAFSKLRFKILKRISNYLHDTGDILRANGAKLLMFKTDSIKFIYQGYYLPKEIVVGSLLGQWKLEFQDYHFRMKGIGSYEYLDPITNQYTAKVQGKTTLDLLKPREEWQWGDIYQANEVISWILNEETLQIKIITGENPYECKTKIEKSESRNLSAERKDSIRYKPKKRMKKL